MDILITALGIAIIVALLYLAFTGTPVPPALKMVVLIAAAVLLLYCVLHMRGCPVYPAPHIEGS